MKEPEQLGGTLGKWSQAAALPQQKAWQTAALKANLKKLKVETLPFILRVLITQLLSPSLYRVGIQLSNSLYWHLRVEGNII